MVNREQLVIVSSPIRTRGHEVKTVCAKFKAKKWGNTFTYYINKLCNFLHKTFGFKAFTLFRMVLYISIEEIALQVSKDKEHC